ncbi:MAG: hypothetical protein WDW36_003732 [Sanguina aurantia]
MLQVNWASHFQQGTSAQEETGHCTQQYSHTIAGIAGMFSLADITLLSSCFAGDIDYMEPDGIVMKAEHVSKPRSSQHPKQAKKSLSSEEQQQRRRLQWLQRRDHQYQQQQQQQPVPAATDSKLPLPGVQTEERLNTISSRGERQVPVSKAETRSLLHAQSTQAHLFRKERVNFTEAGSGLVDARPQHRMAESEGWANTDGAPDSVPPNRLAALRSMGIAAQRELFLMNLAAESAMHHSRRRGHNSSVAAADSHTMVDFVNNSSTAEDCDGHGTHVGSTAIGRSVGVAKEATVVAIRVLDCTGSGSISNTVAGLDWVAQHAQRPAIVMMSLGVSDGVWASSLESSVQSLVRDHGILAVVASGNSAVDACSIAPARCSEALTVAASNMDNKFAASGPRGGNDTLYRWSNTGACVTLFAPGVEIYGACGGPSRCADLSDAAYAWASGTSMAVPHVAGVAAQLLSSWPTATPAQVTFAILQGSTPGRMNDPKILTGTPNRLLYSRADWGEAVVQSSGGN